MGEIKEKKENPTTLLSSIEMPMQPIMFDGDSRTMLLHHALGINDVRRTELQNRIKFFLEAPFKKIFLPYSLIVGIYTLSRRLSYEFTFTYYFVKALSS